MIKKKIVKSLIILPLITTMLTGCGKDPDPFTNFTILDAKVSKIEYKAHESPSITVESGNETYSLKDYDSEYVNQIAALLRTSKQVGNNDLVTFDFIVSYSLGIEGVSLSKNRKH